MATANNTPKRLSDKVKPWVIKALKELSPDEVVTWEAAINVFPDPSVTVPAVGDSTDPSDDEVALLPALVLYLEIPAGKPNTSIYASPILPPFMVNQEGVRTYIKDTLDSLRERREQYLKEPLTEDE